MSPLMEIDENENRNKRGRETDDELKDMLKDVLQKQEAGFKGVKD